MASEGCKGSGGGGDTCIGSTGGEVGLEEDEEEGEEGIEEGEGGGLKHNNLVLRLFALVLPSPVLSESSSIASLALWLS